MTEFKMLKEMAHGIQSRFGGAPVIDVANHSIVFRDSVIAVQLCASKFAECLWVVDAPGDYRAFRRSGEALDVLASIYSYSLV